MKNRILLVFLWLFTLSASAQTNFVQPEQGFYSDQPAAKWEDALLSGNGTMGIMTMGSPYDETIIINHAFLYRPNKTPDHYIDQARRMPQIRQLLAEGKYHEAGELIPSMHTECDYNVDRDPFITGFDLEIAQATGKTIRYQRGVNYGTAETFTEWTDENGYSIRKAFVSRKDSIIAVSLKSEGKINCTISFEQRNQLDKKGQKIQPPGFASISTGVENGWMVFRARYENENPYNLYKGYEGTGCVTTKGGKQFVAGNKIIVTDASEVTVLLKIEPLKKEEETSIPAMQAFIKSKSGNYDELLVRNTPVHNALFSTVRLNLNASKADLALPTDELIQKSHKAETLPAAMIERAFDAGRYNIICSTGSNPPNLQGLWSGTWTANWSGSFTVNGNLQTAIAFILSGNTPSLMQGYFDYNARQMDGFRKNAHDLFGYRGFNVPSQLTVSPLYTDFFYGAPHNYWTGGAGWTAWQYFDYYRYTGDVTFLRTTAYPLMKEAAAFYEDFLTVEQDGKYVFTPSYSPENSPDNRRWNPTSINATMDIMIAKQLLRSCITAAKALKQDAELVKTWQKMLTKMPDYQVSEEGYFKEWLWPGLSENNNHRHASHLYALYDEIPSEITNNPTLLKAIEKTIDARFGFRKDNGGMAFGMVHTGLAAAHTGNVRQTEFAVNTLARDYWATGMASYHDPGRIFNMDISGGFPYLVSQALAYSEPGYLKLLPALPLTWKKGSIEGLRLRGNVILQKLSWDEKQVTVTLLAAHSGTIKIETGDKTHSVKVTEKKPVTYTFDRWQHPLAAMTPLVQLCDPQLGFGEDGFDDIQWLNAGKAACHVKINSHAMLEPTRIIETFKPVSITGTDTYKIDMGKNFIGWMKIDMSGLS